MVCNLARTWLLLRRRATFNHKCAASELLPFGDVRLEIEGLECQLSIARRGKDKNTSRQTIARQPESRHGMWGCGEGVVEVSGLDSGVRGRHQASWPCASELSVISFLIAFALPAFL